MKNAEKKEVLKAAFAELLDKVLPDDEVITKADALSVLSNEDILSVVGAALGVRVDEAATAVTGDATVIQ